MSNRSVRGRKVLAGVQTAVRGELPNPHYATPTSAELAALGIAASCGILTKPVRQR